MDEGIRQLREDEPPKAKSLRPLRMVVREAAKYPGHLAAAWAALLVTSLATLAIPAGLKLVVDRGFAEGGDPADIARWFRYLLLIVCVLGLGTAFRFYFVSWLGERVVADLRSKVHANLLRLAPAFFEENSPREISSRMTSDTAIIVQVVGTTVSVALRNAIMAVLGTGYLIWLAPQLSVTLFIAIPVVIIPIALFGRRLRDISRTSQDRVADVGAMVAEVLGAMKIVQAFNQERREGARFDAAVEDTFATAKIRIFIRAIMTAAIITLIFGALTLLMWRGATMVSSGEISGGTILAFVIAGGIVAGAFGALTEV